MLPTLHTARILLVPLGPEHLDELVALDADPEVMRYLTGRAGTREEVEGWLPRRTDPEHRARGLGYWVGYDGDAFLGWWALVPPHREDQQGLELGYRLMRARWRQGYASEGAAAVLAHAFVTLRAERVFAETMAVNLGSRGVMARVGMRYVRTFHLPFDDPLPASEEGEVEYAVTAGEWRAVAPDPSF